MLKILYSFAVAILTKLNFMRKKNSLSEFGSQRSKLLLENFRRSIVTQSQISFKKAFHDAANAPAPRFWVSEARATRVVAMMMKGENPLEGMRKEKREMYLEIFRRVNEMKDKRRGDSLGDLVFEVVNSEAPKSYLDWQWAQRLILKEKKARIKR